MPALSEQGLALCREAIERHVAASYAPGAVGLVACGDRVESFAAGTAEAGGERPMRRDTIFRIASMTKPITAAAVMMLVEDGRLTLDEPIDRLLPELADRRVLRSIDAEVDDTVPAARPITVRDLLTFQMGFGVVMAMPGTYPIQRAIEALDLAGFGMPDPRRPHDNDEWIRRLATLPLMAQPGADWLYTTGSNVQGVLIARATGQSLGAFLEERILGPLGMSDTGFFVPAGKQQRFVPAYQSIGGALVAFDDAATGGWSRPPPLEAGDSGLVSTVDDFLKFARMLLDRGRHGARALLSEQSVAAMSRNCLTPAQRAAGAPILAATSGWGFGMGVMVDDDEGEGIKAGTLHWTGGLGTSWFTDPASGLTAIVMTQRAFESPVLPGIHAEFQRAARKALA